MKYVVGQKIKFRGKVAYVIECIHESSNPKLLRYYVDSDGWRFSVTHQELLDYNDLLKQV